MHTTYMQFEIAPATCGNVVAGLIGAVEAEEKQRIHHHLLRLEMNPKLRVLKGYVIGCVGLEEGLVGDGKDNRWLRFLDTIALAYLC